VSLSIVFTSWPACRLTLATSSDSVYLYWNLLFPLLRWNVAPLRQMGPTCWLHSGDQVSTKLIRNKKQLVSILETTYLNLGSQVPFIVYRNNFISREYNLNWKHTQRQIFCLRAQPHGVATEQNLSFMECIK